LQTWVWSSQSSSILSMLASSYWQHISAASFCSCGSDVVMSVFYTTRQIVTSQTTHTKYNETPPWKFSACATGECHPSHSFLFITTLGGCRLCFCFINQPCALASMLRLVTCFYMNICDVVVAKFLYIAFLLIHKEQFIGIQVHALRTTALSFWGNLDGCLACSLMKSVFPVYCATRQMVDRVPRRHLYTRTRLPLRLAKARKVISWC